MKVYVFSIQYINKENGIDYSVVQGVYTDKEIAKQIAKKECEQQQRFWKDSIARKEFKKNKEGFCSVILERPDGDKKRYRIEAMELQ